MIFEPFVISTYGNMTKETIKTFKNLFSLAEPHCATPFAAVMQRISVQLQAGNARLFRQVIAAAVMKDCNQPPRWPRFNARGDQLPPRNNSFINRS